MKSAIMKSKLYLLEDDSSCFFRGITVKSLEISVLEEDGQILLADFDELVQDIKNNLDPCLEIGVVTFLSEGISHPVTNSAELVSVFNQCRDAQKTFVVVSKRFFVSEAPRQALHVREDSESKAERFAENEVSELKETKIVQRKPEEIRVSAGDEDSKVVDVSTGDDCSAVSSSSPEDDLFAKLQRQINSAQETLHSATEFVKASRDEASSYKAACEKLDTEVKQLDLVNRELRAKNVELQTSLEKTLYEAASVSRDAELLELKIRTAGLDTCKEVLGKQVEHIVESQKSVVAQVLESMRAKMMEEMRESLAEQQACFKALIATLLDPIAVQLAEDVSRIRGFVSRDLDALRREVKTLQSSRLIAFTPNSSTEEYDSEFEEDSSEDESTGLFNLSDLYVATFSEEMNKLKSLGFKNASLNSFLLEMHKGDIDAVIQYLKAYQ